MKTTMTASEFERAVLQRLMERSPAEPTSKIAREVAEEAGLEFAPEPVELPAALMVGPLGPSGVWIGQNSGGETFSCRNETARPLAEALADRYNAYPGLRAAAGELACRVSGFTGTPAVKYLPAAEKMRDALADLQAELAKGPK